MMPFSRPKTPSTATPINRKGRLSIKKTGYNTKAKIANGQQSIKQDDPGNECKHRVKIVIISAPPGSII